MPQSIRRLLPLMLSWCAMGAAAEPLIFQAADAARGQQLMTEAKCEACHARHVGGNGTDIYNPAGKIKTAGSLRGMVEYCSTQLNLGFFPEDSTDVAAALNRLHYRFKD